MEVRKWPLAWYAAAVAYIITRADEAKGPKGGGKNKGKGGR